VAGIQQLTQLLQLPVGGQCVTFTCVLEGQYTAGFSEHMTGALLKVQLLCCRCTHLEAFREAVQQLLLRHTQHGCHLQERQWQ
jgi:hypothetical protein